MLSHQILNQSHQGNNDHADIYAEVRNTFMVVDKAEVKAMVVDKKHQVPVLQSMADCPAPVDYLYLNQSGSRDLSFGTNLAL